MLRLSVSHNITAGWIVCPRCGNHSVVGHFDWDELGCEVCQAEVPKTEWGWVPFKEHLAQMAVDHQDTDGLLVCPHCENHSVVRHFDWDELGCPSCHKRVAKVDWGWIGNGYTPQQPQND